MSPTIGTVYDGSAAHTVKTGQPDTRALAGRFERRLDEPERGARLVVRVLGLLVVLTMGIPSVLVVHPLGAAGVPAALLGDLLLLLWAGWRLFAGPTGRGPNAVRWVISVFAVAMLISYVAGMLRPLSTLEVNSADRGLLLLGSWLGVVLVVTDAFSSAKQADRVLRILVVCGGLLAVVGYLQFFFGLDLASYIRIPGLTANHALDGFYDRSGFRRIRGTALHSIEFGSVLTLILPMALHYAMNAPKGRRIRNGWPAAAIIGAMPLTVARSAMLGMAVVLILLAFTWSRRQRVMAMLVALAAVPAFMMVTPHLLGTIKSLFVHAGNDPSIGGRTDDYSAVAYYVSRAPIFGRGFRTFIPDIYRILDNQYLGTLVESGVLGLIGLLVLLVGSIWSASTVVRRTRDRPQRSMAYSLLVSVVAAAVCMLTFDGFGFPMFSGILFLVIGCIGALARNNSVAASDTAWLRPRLTRRSRYAALTAIWLIVASLCVFARSRPPTYVATVSANLFYPSTSRNIYISANAPHQLAEVLDTVYDSDEVRESLIGHNATYDVALGKGSLAHDTDVVGTGGPLTVAASAPTADRAVALARAVINDMRQRLTTWQDLQNVPSDGQVAFRIDASPSVAAVYPRPLRAESVLLMIGLFGTVLLRRSAWRVSPRRMAGGLSASASRSL